MQQGGEQASQFSDPYTGGSRYIPGTGVSTGGGGGGGGGSGGDPLTGGSRYIPGTASQQRPAGKHAFF